MVRQQPSCVSASKRRCCWTGAPPEAARLPNAGKPCSNRAIAAGRPLLHPPLPITATAVLLLASCTLAAGSGRSQVPLQQDEPIRQAHARLQQQGWQPAADGTASALDRDLAGNDLQSLSACSGTGAGFCRYDYRRGELRLELITVPGADGEGRVLRWREHH